MRKTLVWFVISAAFIGPGTVTIATSAGAQYGPSLLWTIIFAVFACILLQEGAARINIASGKSLGEVIATLFKTNRKNSYVALAVTFSIVLGCAAYEAGNILGAISGITLVISISRVWLTIGIISIAGFLLYSNNFNLLTNFLAGIIGVMGLGLLVLLFTIDLEITSVLSGLVIPKIPNGAELLTIGLIGTTVVPYNLFLGSKIGERQDIRTMRKGLAISVVIGGLISASLILLGSQIEGDFSFSKVASTLTSIAGPWAHYIFAFGLFAAGLTSAITAPWAASITVSTSLKLKNKEKAFRITWVIVLLTGLIFGISEVKPIPIIILAQALNGIILPFLSITILVILNSKEILKEHVNGSLANLGLLFVVWATLVLGLINLLKAINRTFDFNQVINSPTLIGISVLALIITGLVAYKIKPGA